MATHYVYRFYAELENYTPKIWRRFEVNGGKTIAELGYVLMTLFEMKASHLFCFTYDFGAEMLKDLRKRYSENELGKQINYLSEKLKVWRLELPFDEIMESKNEECHDASQYIIKNLVGKDPLQLGFEYDYGDGWQIKLMMEHCEKIEINASKLPRVLDGEGFGIVEDCGGPLSLGDMAKAFKKKKGQEYKQYREWLGVDDLDLTIFDLDDMNFRLKKLPRVYKEYYEYGYEPTQRMIDLIERRISKANYK